MRVADDFFFQNGENVFNHVNYKSQQLSQFSKWEDTCYFFPILAIATGIKFHNFYNLFTFITFFFQKHF